MAHAQALRSLRGHREAPTGQGGSRSADLPAWVPGSGSQSWFRGHIRPLAGAGPLSLHGWAVSTDGGLARYGAGGGTAPPSPSPFLTPSNAVDMPHRKKINERVGIQSFLFQIAALPPRPYPPTCHPRFKSPHRLPRKKWSLLLSVGLRRFFSQIPD